VDDCLLVLYRSSDILKVTEIPPGERQFARVTLLLKRLTDPPGNSSIGGRTHIKAAYIMRLFYQFLHGAAADIATTAGH